MHLSIDRAAWVQALNSTTLPEKSGENQLDRFLRQSIAPFVTPDPKAWRRQAGALRKRALQDVYLRGFTKKQIDAKPRVKWGATRSFSDYRVRKLRYEAYPGYWIPALLYEPKKLSTKAPVMLNPNGHHTGGKAATYKQARCINLAKRGVIALSMEFIGMAELGADKLHDSVVAYLDQTGLAGVGVFYLALKKGLDILLDHRHADRKRVGVTGLSGGGWQSIVLAALDPRVTLSVPVAGFTSVLARVDCYDDIGDFEQIPADLTTVLDFTHMTAMLAPNPTLLLLNEYDDCCFRTDRARPVIYDALVPHFRNMGAADRFETHSNVDPGTHNYEADHRNQLYRFLNKHWGLAGPEQDVHDDATEILAESELEVGLPNDQLTLMRLATERATRLVGSLKTPRTTSERSRLRKRLEAVIRLPDYADAPIDGVFDAGATTRVVSIGPWQVPVSGLVRRVGDPAQLVVNDQGRAQSAPIVAEPGSLSRFVPDLLGTGELRYNYRHLTLVDTVGQRLLGVRVAQLLAVARHLSPQVAGGKLELHACGPVGSLTGLVAAALRPQWFSSVTAGSLWRSLLEPMQWTERYWDVQGTFCFGLLEVADIPQIISLLEGVELRQPGRCVKTV